LVTGRERGAGHLLAAMVVDGIGGEIGVKEVLQRGKKKSPLKTGKRLRAGLTDKTKFTSPKI